MMKIVATLNIKNEKRFLKDQLSSLSTYVDEIIIVDDGSNDGSIELYKNFEKVKVVVSKNEGIREEVKDWNLLIKIARERNADWILHIDADEFLEPKIKTKIKKLVNDKNTGLYHFKKITVWRDKSNFRIDRSEKFIPFGDNLWNPILVRITPELKWKNNLTLKKRVYQLFNTPLFSKKPQFHRGPLVGVKKRQVYIPNIVALHYNAIDYRSFLFKNFIYAINHSKMHPNMSPDKIAMMHMEMVDETGLQTSPIKKDWLWPGQNLDEYVDQEEWVYKRTSFLENNNLLNKEEEMLCSILF